MNKEEVLKLSKLARIEIGDAEAEKLSREFDAILGYVGEVKAVSASDAASLGQEKPVLRNVLRDDANPHESGIHTEAILSNAPAREGDYVKVKKIL